MFGQKVTLTPTGINNTNINSGPLNLGSTPTSTVSLGVQVDMPAIPGNGGTIKIISVNGMSIGTVTGGDGGALYFGEGKTAVRSFTIQLNWGDFDTTGDYIYAEYKTSTSVVYKSSSIAIIKNATINGGSPTPPADAPNPSKIVNTLCCNQTIRLGDKPAPITGSQYQNPYSGYSYGINARWTSANATVLELDNISKTLYLDYTTELKNITVTRGLGYTYKNDFANKSNTATITVVPSPITTNEIFVNSAIDIYGSAEISDTNPKEISGDRSFVNLNILQDPFYVLKRGETTSTTVDRYEWEYRTTNRTFQQNSIWNTIPNQFSVSLNSSYIPKPNNSEDNFYLIRRIAVYGNIKRTSNVLKISLHTIRENNTICCDQTLQVSSSNEIEKPSIITGTTTISDKNTYLSYQWQSQAVTSRGTTLSNWTNISKAISKDYLPPVLELIPGNGRNPAEIPTYNYRRIATDNIYDGETYYSNEISLTPSTNISTSTPPFKLYPNPASSIINIENADGNYDLANAKISIANTMGSIVNSNNFSVTSPNLISINVSNLVIGTYFVNIETARRNFQMTFIKTN
jgi:hypothetical protein